MPLLSKFDFLKYAPVSPSFPLSLVTLYSSEIESSVFTSCKWSHFYKMLKEDLIIYTVPNYTPGSYNTGTLFRYMDSTIVSTRDLNTSLPSSLVDWDSAPKFNKECNNEIWNVLRKFISLSILSHTISMASFPPTAAGSTKFVLDNAGRSTVDVSDIRLLKNDFLEMATILKREICLLAKKCNIKLCDCHISKSHCSNCNPKFKRI